MTTQLTTNFTLEEFEREGIAVPAEYLGNVQQLASLLEAARAAGGNLPMTITSGYRIPALNALAGGAADSQHLTASAADFTVPGGASGAVQWATAVASDTSLPPWGQMIVYPYTDGHIHLSLPGNNVRQVLVATGDDSYTGWDGVAADLPPWGSAAGVAGSAVDAPGGESDSNDTVAGIVLAVLLFLLVFAKEVTR